MAPFPSDPLREEKNQRDAGFAGKDLTLCCDLCYFSGGGHDVTNREEYESSIWRQQKRSSDANRIR